jgi:acetolactate synthase-1/2/3 large subunit
VPKDVQFAACNDNGYRRLREAQAPVESPALERAAMLLRNAKRPLILAGHGVTLAGAEMELRLLAERTGIPVVTTLLG